MGQELIGGMGWEKMILGGMGYMEKNTILTEQYELRSKDKTIYKIEHKICTSYRPFPDNTYYLTE